MPEESNERWEGGVDARLSAIVEKLDALVALYEREHEMFAIKMDTMNVKIQELLVRLTILESKYNSTVTNTITWYWLIDKLFVPLLIAFLVFLFITVFPQVIKIIP